MEQGLTQAGVIRVHFDIPVLFAEEGEFVGPPALPGLMLKPLVSEPERPSQIFIFGEWKGLSEGTDISPESPQEPEPVAKVRLPKTSSQITSIKERKKPIKTEPLLQEKVMEILNKIDMYKLEGSIETSKGGYQLKDLKVFAKQLGIPATNLRKAGIARRILEKIRLKEE